MDRRMNITNGRIDLIIGPMFAGKSTELVRRIQYAELSRNKCILCKFSKDNCNFTRDALSTHDMVLIPAIPCSHLVPLIPMLMEYDVIGVDEGQFYPDIVEFSETMANAGKTVIIAALDGTFQRRPFGKALNLISKCESITKLTAVCKETGCDAPFTKRIIKFWPKDKNKWKLINVEDEELIGGSELYNAVSRGSYFNISTRGKVNVIIGSEKSGKTTELIRILERFHIASKKLLLIRHVDACEDHHNPPFNVIIDDKLPKVGKHLNEFDIIGVDEAQRFEGLSNWADSLANAGKTVVISALDGDSDQNPFKELVSLIPKSETIKKLDSVCPLVATRTYWWFLK